MLPVFLRTFFGAFFFFFFWWKRAAWEDIIRGRLFLVLSKFLVLCLPGVTSEHSYLPQFKTSNCLPEATSPVISIFFPLKQINKEPPSPPKKSTSVTLKAGGTISKKDLGSSSPWCHHSINAEQTPTWRRKKKKKYACDVFKPRCTSDVVVVIIFLHWWSCQPLW